MKNLTYRHKLPVVFGICLIAAMLASCEEGPDTSAVTSWFAENPYNTSLHQDLSTVTLTINPTDLGTKVVTYDGGTIVLTAAGGTPPYSWSVQDVGLGTILRSRGYYAVYQRNAPGDNGVILRDKNRTEVFCIISQPEETEE